MTPSEGYMKVAKEVQEWILAKETPQDNGDKR